MERIIVVDDEADSLPLYERFLAKEGREVHTFSVADDALRALTEETWDVLITDLMMPELDGFGLLAKARELGVNLPCIAVTGYGSDSTVSQALETDCFGYLNKPFDWNYLNLLVDKAIRSSARPRGRSVPTGNPTQIEKRPGGCVR